MYVGENGENYWHTGQGTFPRYLRGPLVPPSDLWSHVCFPARPFLTILSQLQLLPSPQETSPFISFSFLHFFLLLSHFLLPAPFCSHHLCSSSKLNTKFPENVMPFHNLVFLFIFFKQQTCFFF